MDHSNFLGKILPGSLRFSWENLVFCGNFVKWFSLVITQIGGEILIGSFFSFYYKFLLDRLCFFVFVFLVIRWLICTTGMG